MLYSLRGDVLWLLILIVAVLSGCQPQLYSVGETEEKVEEAKDHVEMAERVDVKENSYNDFVVAQTELGDAENKLQRGKLEDAYSSARRSIQASKRVIKQFYLDTFAKAVETLKTEIEVVVEKDPENPVKDFLPQLDEMLDYADQIQSGQQEVTLEKVRGYTEQAAHIVGSKRGLIDEKLESDVSFGLGRYNLSEQGKAAVLRIVRKIMTNTEKSLNQFPDKTVTIKIKVVGYTDHTGFKEGTRLIKELVKGFEDLVPQSGIERRRFLNQRLSEFRAKTIGNYFRDLILQATRNDSRIFIEQDTIGHGEKPLPDVPSSQVSDHLRRICRIYSYVNIQ